MLCVLFAIIVCDKCVMFVICFLNYFLATL